MSLLVKHIPPQNISSVWDIVEPFIQDALEKGSESKDHSLDYNSSHVQLYLSKGEWMLLVAMDSDEQMKTILGKFGVTKLQGYARKSVVRLWERFNFKPINTLIEVKI